MKCVGILGGMGPEATALFYQLLVTCTPAKRDQDHIPVAMVADPRIPDRTSYLEGGGDSPLPALIEAAQRLETVGADFIVIPCNTAHAFWEEIQTSVNIPLLHLVEETVKALHKDAPSGSSAMILATRGTIQSQIYQKMLASKGLHPLSPMPETQEVVQNLIMQVKAGEPKQELQKVFSELITRLSGKGVDSAILGCTELTLVADQESSEIPLYDSLRILVEATIRTAIT